MLDPPYGIIWKYLSSGRVVPFLGAGCSVGAASCAPGSAASPLLPSGHELALALAEESSFPPAELTGRPDLAKISSFYQESDTRNGLLQRLREVFAPEYPPRPVHQFLAAIDVPLLIVTTNYDNLLEQAFRDKPYHLVVHPTDNEALKGSVLWWKPGATRPEPYPPKSLPLSLTDTTIIYKMHGGISPQREWAGCVITEEDYVDFLSRMSAQSAIPARFLLHFRACRFLFLGYGLGDWNLRVMLRNLRTAGTEPDDGSGDARPLPDEEARSWAIQHRPSELEKILWRKRQVNIHDMDIDHFVEGMAAFRRRSLRPAEPPPSGS